MAAQSWIPPTDFEEYQLVRMLGMGAMGQVYLAHDRLLDRPVAIKFIAARDFDAVARERFMVEARAIARVQHPNVVLVHRAGELDGRPYLISEFIRGRSLESLPKPMHWMRALELAIGLARGLAAAHRRGVLHRDIKPANALLADVGEVKLVDFGLAKLIHARDAIARLVPSPPSPAVTSSFVDVNQTVELRKAPDAKDTLPDPPRNGANGTATHDPLEDTGRVTRPGVVLGTPHYMAPEVWRGEEATRRSDIYSMGVLLYELVSGRPPHAHVPLIQLAEVIQKTAAKPLAEVAPGVDERFAAIVHRCLELEPQDRFPSGEELAETLEQISRKTPSLALVVPEGNPYRGLAAFEAEHRALFFGRAVEVRTVVERLRHDPFVLVAGDSGVGKSSLCRAGVLPWVEEGALGGERRWFVASFVPGRRPVSSLAIALAPFLGGEPEDVLAEIKRAQSLATLLRRSQREGTGLVIFVDQLEEMVTLSDPEQTALVGEVLALLASSVPGVRILATVRGDFLTRVTKIPSLGEEMTRALYVLHPLAAKGVRDAIVGPARAKNVAFESEALVAELTETATRAEGGLPLLQFALAEMWDARDVGRALITSGALQSIGGVAGALARHADGVFASMLPEHRAIARRVLTKLVTPEQTRARLTEAAFGIPNPALRPTLDVLVRARLLIARESDEGAAYELAHEALITGWSTLRGWLESSAERLRTEERISRAATDWDRLGRTRDALWSERQLSELRFIDRGELEPRSLAFLEASERAVRRRRWTRRIAAAAIPLAFAAVYGALRLDAQRRIDARVDAHLEEARAQIAAARTQSTEAESLRRLAFSRFAHADRDTGELHWARVLQIAPRVESTYGEASRALEAAFALDPARADVRELLGETLFERALLAEHDGRAAQVNDFMQRLTNFDEDGSLRAKWDAPASVSIVTTPPAVVALSKYVADERGRLQLVKQRDLGRTPIKTAMPRGSYLITLEAPNRAPVRLPILLARGESLDIDVPLLRQNDLPKGFVHVPAGRFLFGTRTEESIRRNFYTAAPLHTAETGAYLIARHEVTYAEWIEFLKSMPAKQRTPFLPGAAGGLQGSVRLEEKKNGEWRIAFQPTSKTYSADWGESVRYDERDRRAAQDWLRLPVSGVSWEQGQAYVQFLRSSRRVARARLCTELEWERAARGADDRNYPHGDSVAADDFNHDDTYGKKPPAIGPDEVGSHPESRSPFGIDDMAGNVWEWTQSSLVEDETIIRGGSFYSSERDNTSTNRLPVERTMRDMSVGLRICASPPPLR
jgi:eukaryotic-like serine/threonine-protein kinase